MPKSSLLFGQSAVHEGYITKHDLIACHQMQLLAKSVLEKHYSLQEIIFLRGLLSPKQYFSLIKKIEEKDTALTIGAPFFGQIVVEKGYVDLDKLLECLDIQRKEDLKGLPHRSIDEIMVQKGYLTRQQLEEIIKLVKEASAQKPKRIAAKKRIHKDFEG